MKIKDIIEYTGLSRSVLSKEHLRKVLIQQGIVEEKSDGKLNHLSDDSKDNHLKAEVRRKEEQNRKLKAENLELREECELLRGRLYLLMQRQSLED